MGISKLTGPRKCEKLIQLSERTTAVNNFLNMLHHTSLIGF